MNRRHFLATVTAGATGQSLLAQLPISYLQARGDIRVRQRHVEQEVAKFKPAHIRDTIYQHAGPADRTSLQFRLGGRNVRLNILRPNAYMSNKMEYEQIGSGGLADLLVYSYAYTLREPEFRFSAKQSVDGCDFLSRGLQVGVEKFDHTQIRPMVVANLFELEISCKSLAQMMLRADLRKTYKAGQQVAYDKSVQFLTTSKLSSPERKATAAYLKVYGPERMPVRFA